MTGNAPALSPQTYLQAQSRWHPFEIAFWLATLLPFVLFPDYLSLASQIAITALFALSLDIILGYAGIVSLGHAAFFGIGAYSAGLISKYGWGEPLTGLLISCCWKPPTAQAGSPAAPTGCRACACGRCSDISSSISGATPPTGTH